MKERSIFLKLLLVCGLALGLAGCASNDWPRDGALDGASRPGDGDPVVTLHRKSSKGWDKQLVPASELSTVLGDLSVPAKLADSVYRREFATDAKARMDFACLYASGHGGWSSPPLALPEAWIRVSTEHLVRWGVKDLDASDLCASRKGLAYELYARLEPNGKPAELVLAFRGTENDGAQWLDDWRANLSQLDFGRNDNESYRGARLAARKIIESFRAVLPRVEATPVCRSLGPEGRQLPVTFVGHSLGGGLAQHAAYAVGACDATRAVTFNSSPVTGWFFLSSRQGELRNDDPIIVRAYSDREVLAYVRGITTRFNLPRENREDRQLAFREFSKDRHSMALLSHWIDRSLRVAKGAVFQGH